jgi:hypothetical protein
MGLDDDKQDWMKNTSPRNDKEDKKELGCLGIKFREPVRLLMHQYIEWFHLFIYSCILTNEL